jgi:hypothetical protein
MQHRTQWRTPTKWKIKENRRWRRKRIKDEWDGKKKKKRKRRRCKSIIGEEEQKGKHETE